MEPQQEPLSPQETSETITQRDLLTNLTEHKREIGIAVAALALIATLIVVFRSGGGDPGSSPSVFRPTDFNVILQQSTTGQNPELLQEFLVEKIEDGVNDKETRSAIYWITHRYFDNGGDIYEIYDFIEANPAVHFLKEAETIYPTVFEALKARTITNYSRESLIALLSYYEVIDYYGYGSLAIWGLAANKYSEQAVMNVPNPTDTPEIAIERARYFETTAKKAQLFINRSENFIINNTMQTGTLEELRQTDISSNDLLVGINQHASAVANLNGIGRLNKTAFTVTEMFEYTSELAKNEVPSLYFFTNYLYATALVLSGNANETNVAVPLGRALEYVKTNPNWRATDVIGRVVNSKTNGEASVFSYDLTKKLAALNPDLKNFLKENGWQETDF